MVDVAYMLHMRLCRQHRPEWRNQRQASGQRRDIAVAGEDIRIADGHERIWYEGTWKSLPKGSATRRSGLENKGE
jgi:hypothetical protein